MPQLLRYPNPSDPLNGEAAALLIREPKGYDQKVRGKKCLLTFALYLILEYVQKFATDLDGSNGQQDESEVSSLEEYSDDDNLDDLEL